MRRFLLASLVAVALAGCGSEDEPTKFGEVAQWVKENCGVIVTVATVATVSTQGPLAAASVTAVGTEICRAFQGGLTVQTLKGSCVMVGDVCIEGTVADPDKLDSFGGG